MKADNKGCKIKKGKAHRIRLEYPRVGHRMDKDANDKYCEGWERIFGEEKVGESDE